MLPIIPTTALMFLEKKKRDNKRKKKNRKKSLVQDAIQAHTLRSVAVALWPLDLEQNLSLFVFLTFTF